MVPWLRCRRRSAASLRRAPARRALATDRSLEPDRAEPAHPCQVAAAPFQRHTHRGAPGRRPEELARRFQHCRPGALQQVPDLVHVPGRITSQLQATGAQMPQPGPDRVRALGLITVQGRRQAGDDHRVLRVGLIERQALALAGLVDQQRLHAHQRQATVRGQLVQHPPPVPRRLARQRHRRETRRNGPADRPASSSPSSHAQAVTCRLAIPSESWSVTTAACLLPARSIPTIA